MKKFLKTKKFGNNKVVILQTIINDKVYSLHHNVKINNKTTFKEYWNIIKDQIQVNYDKDYLIDFHLNLRALVWNLDNVKNKNIQIHKNNSSLSIEDIEKKWLQIKSKFLNKRKFSTYITPLKKDLKVNKFIVFSKDLLSNISNITIDKIFVHDENNDLFDFIYNNLKNHFDTNLIEVLQDKNNHYIYIKIFNLKFINSYRIFPIKEKELIDLFKGKNLYDSLLKAQNYYYKLFNLDITSVVSTGSLALSYLDLIS